MFTVDGLLAFHSWSQQCYQILFDHVGKVPVELFTKPVAGFGFPTLRDQLLHIVTCEEFWVQSLQGLERESWDKQGYADVASIASGYEMVAAGTRAWLGTLSAGELSTPRRIDFPDGFSGMISPAAMLHHVLTHGFHHKGQAVSMCRILGYPAPETDLCDAVITAL